jgi:hypothetical protein
MSSLVSHGSRNLPALNVTLGGILNNVLANGNILRCIYTNIYIFPSVCLCVSQKLHVEKKLVKTKEAPLGGTSLETLLVLLLRAWIRVNANLFSHYRRFLYPDYLLVLLGQGGKPIFCRC